MGPSVRFRLESAVFFCAALGFCAAAVQSQWFRVLDLAAFDAFVNRFETPLLDELVIVGIDEQSLDAFGAWPWGRSTQARLLARIGEGQPDAVFVDIVYGGLTNPAADKALAEAASGLPVLALPVIIDALAADRQLVEVLPYPDLLEVTDVLGHAHVELDSDAIARGVYLRQGIGDAHWSHVAHALALALGYPVERVAHCDSVRFSLQNQVCDFVYTTFAGPPGTIPEISAADLLNGQLAPDALAGKIVLLGITTSAAPDSITSPVSRLGRPMAGVEFNGNLFNALVQGRLIERLAAPIDLLVALFCVMLPVLLLPRLGPKPMLLAAISFACVPLVFSVASLLFFRVEVPLAAAVVTCLLCYPYWSWRRHEIAWSFVEAEISRVALEHSRWAPAEQSSVSAAAESLAGLLGAEAVWYDAPPAVTHSRQIVLPGAARGWLVLSRNRPFTDADRGFAEGLGEIFQPPLADARLPGERLAAQIRKLQTSAREVRLGREVGLRGLEEMPIGVAVISALNVALLTNAAWRTLLEVDEQAQGMPLASAVAGIVPPLGRSWLEISRAVLLDRQSITFETQTGAGTPVVVEAAPMARADEPVETWVITVTDISDVRVAERHREEALAFLSHDLRSPMLSVLALVRRAPADELIDEIGRYAQKALAVSEQFLQLSRVQARESFETYEVDLVSILDNAIDHVFQLAREKGVDIGVEHHLGEAEAAWIVGNGEMLERAVVNLLTNAIKYSDPERSVSAAISRQDARFVVSIQDEGIGIPAEEVDQIFDAYFRSSEPRLAEQRGSGLGLRFVKTVIERHGGTIEVASRLNEGSRFTVTLPAADPVSA